MGIREWLNMNSSVSLQETTLPETNLGRKMVGKEDDPFLLGFGNFSGARNVKLLEGNIYHLGKFGKSWTQKCQKGKSWTQKCQKGSFFLGKYPFSGIGKDVPRSQRTPIGIPYISPIIVGIYG